ncbi:hypothetical protein [Streptacidiphilus rugosus]|uniref:hypothetical protein n=1 Tax=Streptacidiphilus rugosus TaxID=405783 RepID=UPI00055A8BBD|nr:hypothetical protein [Streptacidiphilus rugosus]
MHALRALKRCVARPASVTVAFCTFATVAAGLLVAPSAHADGANWSAWSGNCFGWTTWDGNHVTGHTWDHAHDDCEISIAQWKSNESPEWPDAFKAADAYAPNTGADTPTWWHGSASSGDVLYDAVCVWDLTTRSPIECSPDYT